MFPMGLAGETAVTATRMNAAKRTSMTTLSSAKIITSFQSFIQYGERESETWRWMHQSRIRASGVQRAAAHGISNT